jgi:hypothetical protein
MSVVEIGNEQRQHALVEIRRARRHGELKSLAFISHIRGKQDPPILDWQPVTFKPHMRFRDQCMDQRLESRKAFRLCGVHTRAHEVMRQIGMQDAEGRQGAGTFREHDALDTDLIGNRRCMKTSGAAEGDHRKFPRIEALLEQRKPDRCP